MIDTTPTPEKKMTQAKKILAYIKAHGSITSIEAFEMGITSLHRRLSDLEKMHYCIIRTPGFSISYTPDGHKVTTRFKRYSLAD